MLGLHSVKLQTDAFSFSTIRRSLNCPLDLSDLRRPNNVGISHNGMGTCCLLNLAAEATVRIQEPQGLMARRQTLLNWHERAR